jgi:hypothetical protein
MMVGGARPGAGRPSDYTPELAREICEQLACGASLIKICKQNGMPNHRTVHRWLAKHSEFASWCAHARELQAETMVDKILDLGDTRGPVDRGKLAALQWAAEKLSPRKYGNKILLGGDPNSPPIASVNTNIDVSEERYTAILEKLLRET